MGWSDKHWTYTFTEKRRKKKQKHRVHSVFFLSLEDIISRWLAVAVNSSQLLPLPSPALSGGKSTDFLCLNGLAKDIFFFFFNMRTRKKKILCIFFYFLVLDLYNYFVMAPVLLFFVPGRWSETCVGLDEKRLLLVCQSVLGQKPETLKLLQ